MSLCPDDMDQEIDIIMTEVAALVQAEVENTDVTCTFVCLNFRQDNEEAAFANGTCHAIRRSLGEIDMCRPFFLSMLGERYGLVPELTAQDSSDIRNMYEEYPWMQKFKNPFVNTALGYSLLEIEHLYTVLMVEPEGAVVYTRDLSYVQNHVRPDKRKRYLEVGCGNMKTTAARSASSDLKMRLRAVSFMWALLTLYGLVGLPRIVQLKPLLGCNSSFAPSHTHSANMCFIVPAFLAWCYKS